MSEHENKPEQHDLREMLKLNDREKEGALYIAGVVILIFLIVFLASLTHVVLHP